MSYSYCLIFLSLCFVLSLFLILLLVSKLFVLKDFPSLSADEFSCNEIFVYCARWEYQTYYQIIHKFSTTTNHSINLFYQMKEEVLLRGNLSLSCYIDCDCKYRKTCAFGAITFVMKSFLNAGSLVYLLFFCLENIIKAEVLLEIV